MLSLLSTAAVGSLCVDDTHCAQGEFCRIDLPVIARACVERPQYEVYDRCSSSLGHCCPKGTTCSGWFSRRCRPVVGECVKRPEICCLAFPSCKEGFEIDNEEVCKEADFETGRCKKESLCCSTITCVKEEKECVPYAQAGEQCGGRTLPCFQQACSPKLQCRGDGLAVDLPGKCESVITCQAFPSCPAGSEADSTCTREEFGSGACFKESLCGSEVACRGNAVGGCQEDARLCPDGTTVVRDPKNNCEFPACPKAECDPLPKGWNRMFDTETCQIVNFVCNEGFVYFSDNCGCGCRPKDEKSCTLACGTVVPSGWGGKDEGSNACNTCSCKDGLLGCTKIGCPARECPKPKDEKSCTLSCGTVVPSGWGGKDEGGNACNSCGCSDGLLRCTLAACGPDQQEKCPCNEFTKETPCIALAGVCYNAGTCACETHPFQTNCLVAPCSVHSCPAGYKCRDNYCGGCNHQCVKEE